MISRRSFLAGASAAALAQRPAAPAADAMYVSLNSSLTPGKIAWPDFVRLAARVGYGGADVNLGAAMREGLDATRALFAETKLHAPYCSLPVNATRDDAAYRSGMEKLDDAAQFAATIGCNRMVVVIPPASQTPKDELRKIFKERFTAIGEVLARRQIRLGFEFLGPLHFRTAQPHEFIWRMDEMLEFARECGPNLGLLLDVWHWHHAGATAADIVKAGKSRIVTIHLSDAAKQAPEDVRDNKRLLPGEGIIDFKSFFGALRQIGYEGAVSPEPIGRIPADATPEEGARRGLESTLAVMK
jgi:sugar phosphate isomerase/epimerase